MPVQGEVEAEVISQPQFDQGSLRHKTLSAYYPHLHNLGNFLALTTQSTILDDNDPEPFCDLLNNAICALRDGDISTFRLRLGSGVHGSQQEAIDRILCEVGRQSGQDVLLTSNRFPANELPINSNRPHAENRHVHSPSSVLRSLPWRILRHRLGDDAFRRLMVHTSIYLPIGNNCFMQLSGPPIYDLYKHHPPLLSLNTEEDPRKKRKRVGTHGICKRIKFGNNLSADDNAVKKSTKPKAPSPAEITIARPKMFYGRPTRTSGGKLAMGLPSNHLLNSLSSTETDQHEDLPSLKLLRDIFPRLFEKKEDNEEIPVRVLKGRQKRVEAMQSLARELLARHTRMDYGKLFKKSLQRTDTDIKLPVPSSLVSKIDSSQPVTQAPLASPSLPSTARTTLEDRDLSKSEIPMPLQSVSHKQVSRYLTLVLRDILSASIMGSQHNLDTLLCDVRRFVRMKQYEPVNLHTLMQDIRVDDFTWLKLGEGQRIPPGEMVKRKSLAEDFIKWIYDGYLIPLLRNSFYITETAATRYETVYYSHEEWARTTQPHFAHLQSTLLTELDKNQAVFAQQGQLGVSAVRLIPKPNEFRPIVNLGRKIKPVATLGIPVNGFRGSLTANQILRDVHQILTYEKNRHKAELGGSLFGTNEIFAPLRSLKVELFTTHGRIPQLFFVKMDIKAAFDTIKQDKILQIVSDLLDQNHDYCLMLYCLLLPPASQASQGSARRLFKMRAVVDNHLAASFGDHAKNIAESLRNVVIVDMLRRRLVTRDSCMDLLRVHIKENVWQVGKKYFRQKTGIPQGSKISSLLCSFFYACLENEHLDFTRRKGSRLLRYIDDFLFVSDDYSTARRFIDTMSRGFPAYGAEVSKGKTLVSFEHPTGSQMATICNVAKDGESYFPYCGYQISTSTLDIMPDYPRMMNGPLKQSFALRNTRHRGSSFVGWFSRQLENRNHVAYLDTSHNSIETVQLNIFFNFALTTMKVPYYFTGEISNQESKIIYEALCASAEYTYIAGRARVVHAARSPNANSDSNMEMNNNKNNHHHHHHHHYAIGKNDFLYLAKTAMVKVLYKKVVRFKSVLDLLRRDLESRQWRGMAEKHNAVVEKGWQAVKDAKY